MSAQFSHKSKSTMTPDAGSVRIQLLGGFEVSIDGRPLLLTQSAERLVAFLALAQRPVRRLYAASRLWPDVMEERALGNLRSTLWRLGPTVRLVESEGQVVRLLPAAFDVLEVITTARQLARPVGEISESDLLSARFVGELLPGWYEDWVVLERERLRQISLHALEAIARTLLERNRHAEAIDAAWLAIAVDPLRESAHQIIIEAHSAEGNRGQAARHYALCRDMIAAELNAAPGEGLSRLGRTLLAA
jgi:DNA-binding SARP family transcriptional activator